MRYTFSKLQNFNYTYPNAQTTKKVKISNTLSSICIAGKENNNIASQLVRFDSSESLNSIDDYCFYNCSCLTEVTLQQQLSTIGNNAFENCFSLQKINLDSNNYDSIGNYAFNNCTSLTDLQIQDPCKILYFGDYSFNNCRFKDISLRIMTNGECSKYGKNVFSNNTELTSVTLDGSIQFAEQMFENCVNLKNIQLGKYISLDKTAIGDRAFANCKQLTSLTVPSIMNSTSMFSDNGFKDSNLKEVHFDGLDSNSINIILGKVDQTVVTNSIDYTGDTESTYKFGQIYAFSEHLIDEVFNKGLPLIIINASTGCSVDKITQKTIISNVDFVKKCAQQKCIIVYNVVKAFSGKGGTLNTTYLLGNALHVSTCDRNIGFYWRRNVENDIISFGITKVEDKNLITIIHNYWKKVEDGTVTDADKNVSFNIIYKIKTHTLNKDKSSSIEETVNTENIKCGRLEKYKSKCYTMWYGYTPLSKLGSLSLIEINDELFVYSSKGINIMNLSKSWSETLCQEAGSISIGNTPESFCTAIDYVANNILSCNQYYTKHTQPVQQKNENSIQTSVKKGNLLNIGHACTVYDKDNNKYEYTV